MEKREEEVKASLGYEELLGAGAVEEEDVEEEEEEELEGRNGLERGEIPREELMMLSEDEEEFHHQEELEEDEEELEEEEDGKLQKKSKGVKKKKKKKLKNQKRDDPPVSNRTLGLQIPVSAYLNIRNDDVSYLVFNSSAVVLVNSTLTYL